MEAKVISFSFIDTEKLKAPLPKEIGIKDSIVHCIPLSEITSFTLSNMITEEELKIIYKEGFILDNIENDYYNFVRKTRRLK